MAISTLPPAPNRATDSPATFQTKADAFVSAMAQFVTDVNNTEANMTTLASNANTSAVNANTYAANALASQNAAAASANTAVNAPGTSGTSVTSMTIGGGVQTFTTQTGKAWAVGQIVIIARTSDPARRMIGPITAYNSGTGSMSVSVESTDLVGGGPFTDWTISLTADPGSITSSLRTVTISTNTNAMPGYLYVMTASLTLTLPATANAGDTVAFRNMSGTTTCVIAANGKNIMALAQDMTLDSTFASGSLVYANATQGWVLL